MILFSRVLFTFAFFAGFAQITIAQVRGIRSDEINPANSPQIAAHFFSLSSIELSGFLLGQSGKKSAGRTLLAVEDSNSSNPAILEIILDPYTSSFAPYNISKEYSSLALRSLQGFAEYVRSLDQHPARSDKKFAEFDFEGIARCDHVFYLANERVRHVLEIDLKKNTLKQLPVDFQSEATINEGGINAGFEGIAADCKRSRLYVAKERGPRLIYVIDLKSNQIIDRFDFSESTQSANVTRTFNSTEPKMKLNSDIADLVFHSGFLYALERNAHEVVKLDPIKKTVIDRIYFGNLALISATTQSKVATRIDSLYETNEPYGLAEALFVTSDSIWIGFDNNENSLYGDTQSFLNPASPKGALILELRRPKGF